MGEIALAVAAPRDLPDCSTTACPNTCQCAESKCATEIEACLADASCAKSQGCVDQCACGSLTCIAACATANPTAKGLATLKCLKSSCPSAAFDNATGAMEIALAVAAPRDLPDCSTTACPNTCQCAESKFAIEIEACLADASCAKSQSCVDQC